LAIPPKTYLNCREGDISILTTGSGSRSRPEIPVRIAPIPSRSNPTLPFVPDDLIASSRWQTGLP
jgi:hypothetical protein